MDLKREGRILYVAPFDLTMVNGPGVNEREFVAALASAVGPRAHFVVPAPAGEWDFPRNVDFSRGHAGYHPVHYLANEFSVMRVAGKVLARRSFDLIVFRLGILPLAAAYLTNRFRLPYAVKTLSIGAFDAFHLQEGVEALLGKILAPFNELLFRSLTRRALVVDTCTDADVEYFSRRLELDGESLYKVENATNVDRFTPLDREAARRRTGLASFEHIIGYVGGRPSTRGGAQLVDVAPALRERLGNVGFVIVGEGEGLSALRQDVAKLGLQDSFVFTGLVPYDQVSDYINAFDVGVSFDLKKNTDRIGNSSQKVLQYVACGKPVISGPGGNRFLVERSLGSIVEADDREGIVRESLRWLSLTEAEKVEFAERAVRFARENLTVEAALERRLELWSRHLARRTSFCTGPGRHP